MENTVQYYPPVGFSFKVNVEGISGANEGNFQEVSGLNVKIAPKIIEEGGENTFADRYPSPLKFENIILKRGLLIGSPLITWARNHFELFTLTPKIVNLNLFDQTGTSISNWKFVNAYPVAMKISDFKAQENTLLVETMELCFDYFTNEIKMPI